MRLKCIPHLDITGWARAFAAERIINNTDFMAASASNGSDEQAGSAEFLYFKPGGDTWKFLIWDIDAGFLGLPIDPPLFDFTDSADFQSVSHSPWFPPLLAGAGRCGLWPVAAERDVSSNGFKIRSLSVQRSSRLHTAKNEGLSGCAS